MSKRKYAKPGCYPFDTIKWGNMGMHGGSLHNSSGPQGASGADMVSKGNKGRTFSPAGKKKWR